LSRKIRRFPKIHRNKPDFAKKQASGYIRAVSIKAKRAKILKIGTYFPKVASGVVPYGSGSEHFYVPLFLSGFNCSKTLFCKHRKAFSLL